MAPFIPVDSYGNCRFLYYPEFFTVTSERYAVYAVALPADGIALYFFLPNEEQSVIILQYAVRLRNIVILFEQASRYVTALVAGSPALILLQFEYLCKSALAPPFTVTSASRLQYAVQSRHFPEDAGHIYIHACLDQRS